MSRYNKIGADYITGRDLNHAIDELNDEIEALEEELHEVADTEYADEILEEKTDKIQEEIAELEKKKEEIESALNEFDLDETLIEERAFEDYAREYASELHGDNASWPFDCIDWKQAASDLQSDFTCIEIQGYTYWARS